MTVSRRSAISRAKASAVVPLPIAIVVSSATRAAAARAIARFASRLGSPRSRRPTAPGDSAAPPYVRTSAALAGEALEVPPDRGRRHAEVHRELGDARAAVGAQVVDQASATFRLPHARILRGRRAHCQLGVRRTRICADVRRSCARLRSAPTMRRDGLPAWRGPRPGRVQLAERHVHRAGPRPSSEPAQGAPAGRPGFCHRRGDGRVQARGRPGARDGGDGDAPRPGDRRRAGDRGRIAARACRADRGRRGDRATRAGRGACQPRPAGLGRRQGRSGSGRRRPSCSSTTTPTRPTPPTRSGSSPTSPPRVGRPTSRCSSSRSRSASTAESSPARTGGASSSRPRAG